MAIWHSLVNWLVEILFWPWFAVSGRGTAWSSLHADERLLSLLLLLFLLWLTRRGLIEKIIARRDWPVFLAITIRALMTLLMIGTLGAVSNSLVVHLNGGKMPVFKPATADTEWSVRLSKKHDFVYDDTRLVWLCDYISIERSRVLTFLFPPRVVFSKNGDVTVFRLDYGSPGDLAIIAGIIFSWWTALASTIYSVGYTARRLFRKS